MKFLEGKTPAERNKTIAAIVLGLLAVIAVSYNFLPGSSKTQKSSNANSNAKVVTVAGSNNSNSSERQIPTIQQVREEDFYAITPIPENPFPPVFGGETTRNIFAIYEPPPPALPKPSIIPPPSPPPTPTPFPISVQFVNSNPNPVYARQNDFTLEVGGDKFTADSKIIFNGQEILTQFGGAQRLTGQVPAALIATEGQRQIMVRTQDGAKISNVMMFNVQAPPVPNYNFVGLVSPKRYNNVTALLQDKGSKEYKNIRLGETIGRFKVVSISSKEVVMQDTSLSFRHNLPFMDEKMASKTASTSSSVRPNNDQPSNGFPQGFDPNMQIQYQQNIPGIPSQYTQQQPQQMPQQLQQVAPPKKDGNDDPDDDNN